MKTYFTLAATILALAVASAPVQAASVDVSSGWDGWFEWTQGTGFIENLDSGSGYPTPAAFPWTVTVPTGTVGYLSLQVQDIATPGDMFDLYIDGSKVDWTSSGTGSAYGGLVAPGYSDSGFFYGNGSLALGAGTHDITLSLATNVTTPSLTNPIEGHASFSGMEISSVPEPASVLLFGAGMLGLAWVGRKPVRRG